MIKMLFTLGEKIKEARTAKELTQPQLAKLIGVSNGVISFWENDVNEPKASYIVKLCIALDVTPNYLLGFEDEDGHKETMDYNFEYSHKDTKLIHKEKKL